MTKQKRVLIIGAGIVGLSTAYYLNKKGLEVTVVDDTDGNDNCSFGNAGFISPSHVVPLASPGIISQGLKWMLDPESPFYIKPRLDRDLISWGLKFKKAAKKKRVAAAVPVLNQLTIQSKGLYENILTDENIDSDYNDRGLLILCKTKHALDEETEVATIGEKYGLRTAVFTPEEAMAKDPEVTFDIAGAVYFEDDACMTPRVFMQNFKKVLTDKGVKLQFNTKVKSIETHEREIIEIRTDKGVVSADEYIVTAGSWTPEILKGLKVKIPMQAGKGYSFMLPKPVAMPTLPYILAEGKIAVTPMQHGLRFAGTMEIAGTQLQINQRRVQGIINSIHKYLPQFESQDFNNIEPWAGLRPCTPDGLPYIGRVHQFKNLLVGTGHAMLGWTLGPITGKLLSQMIVDEKPVIDSKLLAVERYA